MTTQQARTLTTLRPALSDYVDVEDNGDGGHVLVYDHDNGDEYIIEPSGQLLDWAFSSQDIVDSQRTWHIAGGLS